MARAGLVGNFLTDLDDAVAARWRFDAGSLILSRPGWSTAGSLAGPSAWGPSSVPDWPPQHTLSTLSQSVVPGPFLTVQP